jgi:5'-nucleotidase
VKRASFPVLAANLDVSADPDLKDRIKAWTILNVGKEKIGVIGAVTPDLPTISNIGEHVKMKELFASLNQAVSDLKEAKISKIFLVSHCGYDLEKEIAAKIPDIDVVVGGHSHSFLSNSSVPTLEGWPTPLGPYPTVVKHSGGAESLVLQGWEWGKVVGSIHIQFDTKGHVSGWREATPIVVDEKIPDNPTIANLIAAFQKPILATMLQKIGKTEVNLDRGGLMRELLPDAMQESAKAFGALTSFMNSGGVRSGIDAGDITLGKLNEVQPFRNTLVILELSGLELKNALETPAVGNEVSGGLLLPSAGTSYSIDMLKPSGNRVGDIVVAGQPIDPGKTYRLAFNNFTAGGGDAHNVLKAAKGYRYDTGLNDIDILVDFIRAKTPIKRVSENRIKVVSK